MRKGQAAMEFLMTYGWAILVVLIAIGALAYFGVLNPARFLPNSCTLFPGLACTEFKVTVTAPLANTVQLFIRNGIGDSVKVTSATLSGGPCPVVSANAVPATGAASTICTAVGTCAGSYTINDGAQAYVNFSGCTSGALGTATSRFKADIGLTYSLGTAGLSHVRTGAIVAQVE